MKTTGLLIIACVCALTLSACSSDWVKESASPQDKSADTADCQVMQNKADNDETFDNCMQGKGWIKK